MARSLRIEVPGELYHVITRGRAIFRDDRSRSKYLERLAFYLDEFSFQLLAYCLIGMTKAKSGRRLLNDAPCPGQEASLQLT
jgi:hypothetical protein